MFVKKLIPFAVAASFAMAGATAFAKTEFVTIGTGGITGVYYPTGGAIAKIVNAKERSVRCPCFRRIDRRL